MFIQVVNEDVGDWASLMIDIKHKLTFHVTPTNYNVDLIIYNVKRSHVNSIIETLNMIKLKVDE